MVADGPVQALPAHDDNERDQQRIGEFPHHGFSPYPRVQRCRRAWNWRSIRFSTAFTSVTSTLYRRQLRIVDGLGKDREMALVRPAQQMTDLL
jgi:hypothetical protein